LARAPGLDDQALRDDRDDPAGQLTVESQEGASGLRRDRHRVPGDGGVAGRIEVGVEQIVGRCGEADRLLDRFRHRLYPNVFS